MRVAVTRPEIIKWPTEPGGTMRIFAALLFAASVLVTGNAFANCTSNTIGSTTFYNCNNGVSGTSNTIGGTTFHNFSDGSSATSNTIGGTTYHNSSNPSLSGTSNEIGGTTFHNW